MNPERLSPLGLYGNQVVFKKLLEQGYVDFVHATGPWIELPPDCEMWGQRMIGGYYFLHQSKQVVAALETFKEEIRISGMKNTSGPLLLEYSPEDFIRHLAIFKICLEQWRRLDELLKVWEGKEVPGHYLDLFGIKRPESFIPKQKPKLEFRIGRLSIAYDR